MSIGHDQLASLLAIHLERGSDRLVWENMQLGPSGSCRPDVWTLNKSYSNPRPLAYEVKVAKSDFQRDVSSGKWQEYLQFSCAVTFAVPLGLVTKAELPKGCGLMVWNGEAWTTTKAPTLDPCPPLPRDLWMKLLIDGAERAAARTRLKERTRWAAEEAVRKKFGGSVATLVAEECDFEGRLARLRERFAERERVEREQSAARRQRDESTISRVKQDVCAALAMPQDAAPWELKSRARELIEAVNRDEEVKELRRRLNSIRDDLQRAENTPAAKLGREFETVQ